MCDQTSVSSGATLRSPTRIGARAGEIGGHAAVQLVDEGELVGEFQVDRRIGLVAAGGNVEIVDGDGPVAIGDARGDVAAIVLAAELPAVDVEERQPRDDGDAVIALLAVDRDVPVAGVAEGAMGKIGVRALGFLQAEDVRALFLQGSAARGRCAGAPN